MKLHPAWHLETRVHTRQLESVVPSGRRPPRANARTSWWRGSRDGGWKRSGVGTAVRKPFAGKLLIPGLLALATFAPADARADIYTYTDAHGVVHFSTSRKHGAKMYIKSAERRRPKPGVHVVMPSDTSLTRFTRYDDIIRQAGTLYQIPVELIRAVIKVESDYDPRAVSPAGAHGLMQMIPATAQRMQVRDITDPRENIFGGVRYLRILANMFNGDIQLTIAGYNAGEGAVARYGGIPPYEETQRYVTKVLAYYQRYRAMNDPVVASSGSVFLAP